MSRSKRRKLRVCGRWSIWSSTLLLIALIPISAWVGPRGQVEYVPERGSTESRRMLMVHCVDGVLISNYFPQYSQMYFSSPEPGWDFSVSNSDSPWPRPVKWWRFVYAQGGGSGGSYSIVELPLVYPVVLMLGWSWLLVWWRWKQRHRAGHCAGCGCSLEGLTNDVCPECGVELYE